MSNLYGVLVTYERPEQLAEALSVLQHQTRPLSLLVVVDNSPTERCHQAALASGAAEKIVYIPSQTNIGPAGGIALGMERCLATASDSDWLCIFDDDDPLPSKSTLENLFCEAIQTGDRVAGVGAGGAVFDWRRGRLLKVYNPDGWAAVDYLKSGWCPIYRVRAIRDVGVFNPQLFFGFDDLEFGLRLRARSWLLLAHGSPTAASSRSSPAWRLGALDWRRYYSLRNLIHILRSNGHHLAAAKVSLLHVIKPVLNTVIVPRLATRHLAMNIRALRDGWTGRQGMVIAPSSARRPV
jgi:GT2 family glycosyltransferase